MRLGFFVFYPFPLWIPSMPLPSGLHWWAWEFIRLSIPTSLRACSFDDNSTAESVLSSLLSKMILLLQQMLPCSQSFRYWERFQWLIGHENSWWLLRMVTSRRWQSQAVLSPRSVLWERWSRLICDFFTIQILTGDFMMCISSRSVEQRRQTLCSIAFGAWPASVNMRLAGPSQARYRCDGLLPMSTPWSLTILS